MTRRPSILRHALLCAALTGILGVEITLTLAARAQEKAGADACQHSIASIRALGPLAAAQEDLKACEASFGDSSGGQTLGTSALAGKTRLTLELARTLASSGLEEGASSLAANALVSCPEAALAATCVARTEGLRLRGLHPAKDEEGTLWTIDATCPQKSLPELLYTLGKNTSGIALDALDMRTSANGIDLRMEFFLPTGKAQP